MEPVETKHAHDLRVLEPAWGECVSLGGHYPLNGKCMNSEFTYLAFIL